MGSSHPAATEARAGTSRIAAASRDTSRTAMPGATGGGHGTAATRGASVEMLATMAGTTFGFATMCGAEMMLGVEMMCGVGAEALLRITAGMVMVTAGPHETASGIESGIVTGSGIGGDTVAVPRWTRGPRAAQVKVTCAGGTGAAQGHQMIVCQLGNVRGQLAHAPSRRGCGGVIQNGKRGP